MTEEEKQGRYIVVSAYLIRGDPEDEALIEELKKRRTKTRLSISALTRVALVEKYMRGEVNDENE